MSSWVERRFDIRGMTLAAKCWHDPALPPLLALHGWLDNAASYDRLAPLLSHHHIVALDFAGHGLSGPRPAYGRYHTLDHVDDVHAVLAQLGWERFTLMGHSMGAGVATLFAGSFPERIERLVLIEGLGPLAGAANEAPSLLRKAVEQWAAFGDKVRIFASVNEAVAARQQGISAVSEQAARLLCERGLMAVEGGYTWSTDKRLRLLSSQRVSEDTARAFIAAITAPTLLVLGDQGLRFAVDTYQKRVAAHANLRALTLPGGHHLHLDGAVDQVAVGISEFLA